MPYLPDHRRARRFVLTCLAGVAGAAVAVAPAHAAPPTAKLQHALDAIVKAGAPGAAVVVHDGDRTVRLSSGLGRLTPRAPMRATDRTRIGGLTKSFTATVVLQLAAEHKLALNDTVERWLPGVIENGASISVRQVLNHTSGVYDFAGDDAALAPYMTGDLTHAFHPATGVQIAVDHGPLFAPGTGLAYSNTNSLLLAMIAERATGKSFAAQLRSRIFVPLGLRDTAYGLGWEPRSSYTHGYMFLEDGPFDVTPWSATFFGPGGGIASSLDDVAAFYRGLLHGGLLPKRQLQAMKTIDPVATGGVADTGIIGGGWGLGLLQERFPCGVAWGHDSEMPGITTAAWSDEHADRQVVAVVNTNGDHDAPASVALRALLKTAYCGR